MANVDLAEAVHLSPSACLRRVRRLEEGGSIDRYVALVDPSAIGLGTDVFVEITLVGQDEGTLEEFERAVSDRPEIMSCHLMGPFSVVGVVDRFPPIIWSLAAILENRNQALSSPNF